MASALRRILIMAGGTGGHVYPALAVAQSLRGQGVEIEWLGTSRGLEATVVPGAGIKLNCLRVSGFRGKGVGARVGALINLLVSMFQAFGILFRFKPNCVLGMGGYAAAPGGLVAWMLRRPLVIHEQNAVAGTTNRMLAPMARRVCTAYDGAFRAGTESIRVGNPVRDDIMALREHRADSHRDGQAIKLLVLGGSLGAMALNEIVPEVLRKLQSGVVEVWHQCGTAHIDAVDSRYQSLGLDVRVEPYVEDMASAYAWADLALCRAGALTCAELAVAGVPAILVPLPGAIDDHQTANARWLADAGAAVLLPQSQMDSAELARLLQEFADDRSRLASMAAAAFAAGDTKSVASIVEICSEVSREY